MSGNLVIGLAVVCAVTAGITADLSHAKVKTVTKTHTVTVTQTMTRTVTKTHTRTVTVTKLLPSSCLQLVTDLEGLYGTVIDTSAVADDLNSLISSLNLAKTVDSNAAYVKLVETVNNKANLLGDDAIAVLKNKPQVIDDLAKCKEESK